MKTAQKSTADKFHEEKSDSINAAADKKRDSRKFIGERADDGTASVNERMECSPVQRISMHQPVRPQRMKAFFIGNAPV